MVKNYDSYVRRNLSRGVKRQELNVSYVAEKRIKLTQKLDDMREKLDGTSLDPNYQTYIPWTELTIGRKTS